MDRLSRTAGRHRVPVPSTGGEPKKIVIPASGGEPEVVHPGFDGFVTGLDWSPDGQTFAFTGTMGGDEEVWLMSDFLPLVRASRR